ncbi:hypothetical protein DTO021D3_1331 [Paecilomyces variotii]|nr:hypothetical protein DTO032I3_2297 [Paecilomyces variotii]KAJ9282035.1 hypothetical protein DTO021D3_1331 [Paecilomyces variotii]KAJ9286174.1 hypothetical protein DTO021C3_6252 [Paecilomyces variotii]KAJ9342038.1 hypothetical protein DTO027B6_5485 [Paecilomyces variotii]KAJ9388490.1 hypothetical protein DTO032I4_2460 [Paecilomyces variotii]
MKTLTSSAAIVLASSLATQVLSLSPSPVLDAREPDISYGPQPCHPDPVNEMACICSDGTCWEATNNENICDPTSEVQFPLCPTRDEIVDI